MNNNPNYKEDLVKGRNAIKQKWDKIKEDYRKNNPSFCKECNSILSYKKRNNKFCDNSCSASFNNKKRTKYNYTLSEKGLKNIQKTQIKKSNKIKNEYYNNPNYCIICDNGLSYDNRTRKTCSDDCLSILRSKNGVYAGKQSALAQSEERRSKNEKLFANLCKKQFDEVLTNEPIFNGWDADVIIEDIKYAILWNGKWHYEKITEHHSVKQVQNRDKIKIKEIKNKGYIPYVIKDMGKFNEEKVNREFNKLLNYID